MMQVPIRRKFGVQERIGAKSCTVRLSPQKLRLIAKSSNSRSRNLALSQTCKPRRATNIKIVEEILKKETVEGEFMRDLMSKSLVDVNINSDFKRRKNPKKGKKKLKLD